MCLVLNKIVGDFCGENIWFIKGCFSYYGWLVFGGFVLYIIIFFFGMGFVLWVINFEIYLFKY